MALRLEAKLTWTPTDSSGVIWKKKLASQAKHSKRASTAAEQRNAWSILKLFRWDSGFSTDEDAQTCATAEDEFKALREDFAAQTAAQNSAKDRGNHSLKSFAVSDSAQESTEKKNLLGIGLRGGATRRTPLHLAAEEASPEVIQVLIDAKAWTGATDISGLETQSSSKAAQLGSTESYRVQYQNMLEFQ
eukprot:Skav218360  [mRNA]  locus=scaffold2066:48253:53897:+ [translate_table: standard]